MAKSKATKTSTTAAPAKKKGLWGHVKSGAGKLFKVAKVGLVAAGIGYAGYTIGSKAYNYWSDNNLSIESIKNDPNVSGFQVKIEKNVVQKGSEFEDTKYDPVSAYTNDSNKTTDRSNALPDIPEDTGSSSNSPEY